MESRGKRTRAKMTLTEDYKVKKPKLPTPKKPIKAPNKHQGVRNKHQAAHNKQQESCNITSVEQQTQNMSWGYEKDNGPDTWPKTFAAARGPRQSPVNIETSWVTYDDSLVNHPLKINYSPEPSLLLENPGLSFKAHITADSTITGGPLLNDQYKLVQFHFHWGHDDKSGSEHTVNGKKYPCELHLVHYNASKYKSPADAVTQCDGLAVIGVFIKVGAEEHAGFKVLSDNAHKVKCKGLKCETGASFNPASLLPDNTSRYWTYEGSLTTPPCNESVTWIVLQQEITVSAEQMRALRNLCCDECGSKQIPDNYRPPLPLGARGVKSSFAY
ncbi:hypothetical protein BsWGS_16067 [Bradybaena similaris]